jgi:flagellar biosynthesis/type III secretory pathway chaperone
MNPNQPDTGAVSAAAPTAQQASDLLYSDLLENLENLVKVYRSLLDVVRREKDILIASKLDELNENNKSKDTMLIRIRSLENQRIKCATDLAKHVGADHETPRLLDIANHCDPKWSDRLRNMHSVLDLLIRRVADVNKQNEELVQAALSNITGAMEAIRDGLKPKPGYGRQGSVATTTVDGGQLVRREV